MNIYNPQGEEPRLKTWEIINRALEEAEGKIILLRDFNAHHPVWGGRQVASEMRAENLLLDIER